MSGFLKALTDGNSVAAPQFESVTLALENACASLLPSSEILPPEDAVPTFFHLIRAIPQCKQTRDRLAFWQRYCLSKSILQSWICLTTALSQQLGSQPPFRFATLLRDHRVQELHGVLLLRFPLFVVAEWSHLGKCRFWFLSKPHAPKLFQPVYRRDDLLKFPDYTQQHYFPSAGRWQRDADQWIARVTLEASP
ncbi:MAG: hypothetical protein HYW48_06845 [Deltaproteobacteria bacterium]|nr:hypothetical protein [Deltaproteobacteria bacterium]